MSGADQAQTKRPTLHQMGLTVALMLLVPGMRYFMPTGDLLLCKLLLALSVAWLLHTIVTALRPIGKVNVLLRIVLQIVTIIFLVQPNLFFGVLLFAFFRWVLYAALAIMSVLIVVIILRARARLILILATLCLVPLSGIFAFWWNFTMFAGGGFDPQSAPPGVSAVFSLAEWKSQFDVGKAHPYALAYDEDNNVLLASFKDDWGSVFHLGRKHNRNFIAMKTLDDPQTAPAFLFFGTSLQPENLAVNPPEKTGWVNLLNVREQTFHVASFSYEGNDLKLKASNALPAEPNAIFFDAAKRRLLIVGIQMQLMELDPDTLNVRSIRDLYPDLQPDIANIDPINRLYKSELSLMMSLYDERKDRLFFAMVGHYVHALSLSDFQDVRTHAYPLSVGLAYDDVRGELAVAQPVQQRITIINTKTMQVREEIEVGAPIRPVALLRQRDLVLTGAYTGNETMIYDRRKGQMIHRFHLGRLQRHAIATAAGDRAFLATGWGVFSIDVERLR